MKGFQSQHGFALPSVLITSTVMLMVLMSALATVSSVRAGLDQQYYSQLMREAAEAGSKRVAECIRSGTYNTTAVIRPDTDCFGSTVPGYSADVLSGVQLKTSYTAQIIESTTYTKKISAVGTLSRLRTDGATFASYQYAGIQNIVSTQNANQDRATKRYWYFGRAARLDFGVTGTSLPTYSVAAGAPWTTHEGTTVVTDQTGTLQFWSDGLRIWNRNGVAMGDDTGSSTPLIGAGSATQAVVAFPLNSDRTLYAVVSNSGQGETGLGELYLHKIDMTKNSGLGAIVAKNQMLGVGKGLGTAVSYNGNNPDKSYSGEGIGAVPKADGSGFFVYTYNTNTRKVIGFLISINGVIDPTPIVWSMSPLPSICQVGPTSGATSNIQVSGYGSFNFSKDYTKMILYVGTWACPSVTNGTAYYMNVDPTTGALTRLASWTVQSSAATSTHGGYIADFSPGEGYVYTSQIYPTEIARYSLANLSNVAASKWIIGPASSYNDPTNGYIYGGGGIGRGPDGRMYIANVAGAVYNRPCKMSYIGTPDAPSNSTAAIGWSIDAISLNLSSSATGCSTSGVPQMATSYAPVYYVY